MELKYWKPNTEYIVLSHMHNSKWNHGAYYFKEIDEYLFIHFYALA